MHLFTKLREVLVILTACSSVYYILVDITT